MVDKLLEDAVEHTQSGCAPPRSAETTELSGKFAEWKWTGEVVLATFAALDGTRQCLRLPPSQWKSVLALTLRGPSLDRFKENLGQGQFVDPARFPASMRSQYLKLHHPALKHNSYQLISAILSRRALSVPFQPLWVRETHNLMAYFSKRACLYRFKVLAIPHLSYLRSLSTPTRLGTMPVR